MTTINDSGGDKVPLLQIAIEQNRSTFLNKERINAVLRHVWQTPSGLDPTVLTINSESQGSFDVLCLMIRKPFYFYLTPMGMCMHLSMSLCLSTRCVIMYRIQYRGQSPALALRVLPLGLHLLQPHIPGRPVRRGKRKLSVVLKLWLRVL